MKFLCQPCPHPSVPVLSRSQPLFFESAALEVLPRRGRGGNRLGRDRAKPGRMRRQSGKIPPMPPPFRRLWPACNALWRQRNQPSRRAPSSASGQ
ncbi:hypothetical protein Lokhon_01205 [Limimaricola hongkongensis DSM 17492]|uniref:Uncharacterized protein n=1 Tax=Limimaricola hongkongensis DSM 17492 TaxID=1122180 RepID=A0A017HDG5_9RHOB|nr:hypothetical protein Lokhon_01205 [Limimaricola hongkongensis DSM 17492]